MTVTEPDDSRPEASSGLPPACFSCTVAAGGHAPGLLAYRSNLVMVNHYHPEPGEPDRTGWFIAAPVRHVCRWFDLTVDERSELTDVVAAFDAALHEELGSSRTMVASLGWFTLDHLHVHLAPTVTSPVTFGWEHFGTGRYQPLGSDPVAVTGQIAKAAACWLQGARGGRLS